MTFAMQLCLKSSTNFKDSTKVLCQSLSYEFEEMEKKQVIRPVQNGADIYYMNYQYYSNEFGWSKEIVTEMKSLNF